MSPATSRASGILLHITSLPDTEPISPECLLDLNHPGSGDFGPSAYHFIDWLEHTEQHLWQILPLVPAGSGYSPYMSPAGMAFHPLLVDLRGLASQGWLPADFREDPSVDGPPGSPPPGGRIDFPRVERFRLRALQQAARTFLGNPGEPLRPEFDDFCLRERAWLDDYALFMLLDRLHAHKPWQKWPADLAHRKPAALDRIRHDYHDDYLFWCFVQWVAEKQWQAIRTYANARNIRLIGDVPIFVALHSADTWANPQLFELDADLWPVRIAGVPPDYFSQDGQRWGNPLYRWSSHARQGYAWWIARIRRSLSCADIVRIDHFRGFAEYWAIPADSPTAREGEWQPGPGKALFDALAEALGELPLIAEDLGVQGDDVRQLLKDTGLPGMAVLQFAFNDNASNPYLPHNLSRNEVVYTGTHDNDTCLGWFAQAGERERARTQVYLKTDGREINWELIHAASQSVAGWAIYPMQDVLGLGTEGRMNRPGEAEGCWGWRFAWQQLHEWQTRRLRAITQVHGRDNPDEQHGES
ncbi:MAG: 4-alpha-glucanotransferase [Lautropia sp.]|nr:4-alpha-glucanotransferase [Lautropia sp.]